MIVGEPVSVRFRVNDSEDEYGNEIETYTEPVTYENVLCGKGGTVDDISESHPYGIKSDMRFCFEKGFSEDLRGALIERRGKTYKVIGDPVEYTEENLPPGLPWNIRCEGVRFDG